MTFPSPTGTSNGYRQVYAPDHPLAQKHGYVLEHRLVVYESGMAVPPGCHVHHLNGDKADNRLENLRVLPAREHLYSHNGKLTLWQVDAIRERLSAGDAQAKIAGDFGVAQQSVSDIALRKTWAHV